MGKPKAIKAFTNLGFSFGPKPLNPQIHTHPLLGPFSHVTFFFTSGRLWRRKRRWERHRRRSCKEVQAAAAPRHLAVSRCLLRCRTRPAVATWCRCRACYCSLHGSMERSVGGHHPRRRRQGVPIACEPCGGFEPGASGRRGCGESWRRQRYAKCESAWGSPEYCRRKPSFLKPRPRLEGVQTYGGAHERWWACTWLSEARHGG